MKHHDEKGRKTAARSRVAKAMRLKQSDVDYRIDKFNRAFKGGKITAEEHHGLMEGLGGVLRKQRQGK